MKFKIDKKTSKFCFISTEKTSIENLPKQSKKFDRDVKKNKNLSKAIAVIYEVSGQTDKVKQTNFRNGN